MMNCKNCGCKIEENQNYCTKCGAEIVRDDCLSSDFKLSTKTLAIIFASIISLSAVALGATYIGHSNENLSDSILQKPNNNILYKIWQNDEVLFIDEIGNEVLKIKADKDVFVGEFREGRLFKGKQIKDVSSSEKFKYSILELSILDKNGNIIKTFDKKAVVIVDDEETTASYLPEFYNGYAVIHFVNDSDLNKKQIEYDNLHITDIYVDKNGREVKNIPENIKKMLSDRNITATRFETNELELKEMPCSDNTSETCVGYIDKDKKIKINPIYDYDHLCCGDWYGTNPKFISNYALVFTRAINEPQIGGYAVLTGGYRFINSTGEYINDEVYDYAQPFYGNLAYVRTKNKYGFINKQGQWVWSAIDNSIKYEEEPIEQKKILPPLENIDFSYNLSSPSQILMAINDLQAKYFRLIKRSDMLLQVRDYDEYEEEHKHLDKLFTEIEEHLNKSNKYLQQYYDIEKQYANNPGTTTLEMNDFKYEHYKAVDKLLNEVYQEVKTSIPEEDFKLLVTSELSWLKEVENYHNVFLKQGFGSISGIIKLGYEINMRKFRTLLLMLYLK